MSGFQGTNVQVKTPIEHVRSNNGMYVGSKMLTPREELLLVDKSIVKQVVTVPEAAVHIFVELLANAIDNINRSVEAGVNPGTIIVNVDRTTVTVSNQGCPIEVKPMPGSNLLIPEVIFGVLLSSTNFDGGHDRIGCNGIGAKATCILSTSFSVEIYDSFNHKHYKQQWRPVMVSDPPFVEDYYGSGSSVTVSYVMDFDYFGYQVRQHPDEFFYIVGRLCAESCFNARVPVIYNNFNMSSISSTILDYGMLYFGKVSNSVVYYEWAPGVETTRDERGIEYVKNGYEFPLIEMAIFDAEQGGNVVSFANGILTSEGGVHAEAAIKAVSNALVDYVNNKCNGKSKDTTESAPKITMRDIRRLVSIAVSVHVVNPSYVSQSKTKLKDHQFDITLPPRIINQIKKWDLTKKLEEELRSKQMKILKKTNGSKKRFIGKTKGDDANKAGTKNSQQCTLAIVEGESAKNYHTVMLGIHPEGRDTFGVLPIRGKLRNATKATPLQMAENSEFCEIKKLLGLEEGVDYKIPSNRNKLRYGKLMILTDADDDGIHIKGLIIALFTNYYPSILEIDFIIDYRTPYLRARKGTQRMSFYFEKEFIAWQAVNPDWKSWNFKYCKGLGSSSKEDVKEDYNSPYVVNFKYDQYAKQWVDLAFHPELADDRKRWLATKNTNAGIESVNKIQPISKFVDDELAIYCLTSIRRSIPRIEDGLKPSQRKIIHGMLKKWGTNLNKCREIKIGILAAFVTENCKYHHGDSLSDTIVTMARDFVGSNNLPYFTQKSMLGTRDEGGKDAAQPRYTTTTPNWWIRYWIDPRDDALLTHVVDEGEPVEPEFYITLFPIWAINGCQGIATSVSTYIPNHNTLDVIGWLKDRIRGTPRQELIPYYNGFQGTIEVVDKRKYIFTNEEEDNPLEDHPRAEYYKETVSGSGKYSFVSYGNFTISSTGLIEITELPIGLWTSNYKEKLIQLETDKRISNLRNRSDDVNVYFSFDRFVPDNKNSKTVSHSDLGLRRSYGMTNMVLLTGSYAKHYNDMTEMLEAFYQFRLPLYEKRKISMIDILNKKKHDLSQRAKFIIAVISGSLVIIVDRKARPAADVYVDMDRLGIEHKYLDLVSYRDTTKEKVDKLNLKIDEITTEINSIQQLDIKDMWLTDLEAFEKEYMKHNPTHRKQEPPKPKLQIV